MGVCHAKRPIKGELQKVCEKVKDGKNTDAIISEMKQSQQPLNPFNNPILNRRICSMSGQNTATSKLIDS